MKNLTHSLFLFLTLLFFPATASAYSFCVNGIYYDILVDNEAEVTYKDFNYNSYSGNVIIPATVTYGGTIYSVTSIGYSAFSLCSKMTSITIPNTITHVGSQAFSYCIGLKGVYITDLDAWCKISFDYNQMQTNPCSYAHHLYLNGEEIRNLIIPNSVTSIGMGAFAGCSSLTSITIPNSVTTIRGYAFMNCKGLTEITIPRTVTSIRPNNPFLGCTGLSSITVDSDNLYYHSSDNCNAIIETATNSLISGCKNTIIPNNIATIYSEAFYGCTGLKSVSIPQTVTTIGNGVFYNCDSLLDVYSYIEDLSAISFGFSLFLQEHSHNYSNRTLYVPHGTSSVYRSNQEWGPYFGQIVEMPLNGDANVDGVLNIADISDIIDYLLGNDMILFNVIAADMNGNGRVDLGDLAYLIDMILQSTSH